MERSEPTFVPEWLKSSGSLSTISHQFQSSSLHSDEQGLLKTTRNKSLVSISDNESTRPSISERTTSSYLRRASSSNGSPYLRSYGSFDREKSVNRHRDHSDPFGSILPSRFEKEGLRRSHSSVSTKRGESWPRKVAPDSTSVNKTSLALNNGGTIWSGGVKTTFERDFPSLGTEEKQTDYEIGRVPSPGLGSAIQSLPVGNVAVIGGDGWTSALAEVPVIVGSNGSSASVGQPVQSTTTISASGRNMAETLVQGPPRSQTAPQLSVGTQRLEELAVKQSRQLIPVTPSMPKALVLNNCDKPKPKGAPVQLQSSHLPNSPRPVSTKSSKLHVLKLSHERNGVSPTGKDNVSPTAGGKLPNSPLAVARPNPLRNNNSPVVTLEKRSSSQAQSRNDFFNLMRKKSMAAVSSDNSGSSISAGEAVTEGEPGGVHQSNEGGDGDAEVAADSYKNGKSNWNSDAILYSEEEEARFLRSLGWEETAEDDYGLTEEEINSFYRDASKYMNLQAASKIFKGTQPKLLIPLHSQTGNNGEIPSDSKLES